MTTEEQYDAAQEEAAFETGFNATDDEPAAVAPAAETTPDEPAETPEPSATEPAPPQYLSLEEFTAALAAERAERQKMSDRVFGKVGELQQRLDAIKGTAAGISPRAKERLAAEFPELAEMLFDGADEPAPQPPPVVATPPAMPQVDELSRTFERKLLKRDHRDWEQVVASPEFSEWKTTVLEPEDAVALNESWDADFVSAKLTQFKEWQQAQQQSPPPPKPKPNRLDAAVTPRGIPRTGLASADDHDEEAAMLEAFGGR